MNWYHLKRLILTPYIWYMRRRERHQDDFIRNALEQQYYRPGYYRFIAAVVENPDLAYEAPIGAGDLVLDVGAYEGEWTARMYEKYHPRIDIFEADPTLARRLEARFADRPDIRCFGFGLGARDAELPFIRRGMGSTFHQTSDGHRHGTITATIRDIAGVLDELGHDRIDLLKLDIQGAEYDVMERLIDVGRIPTIRCFLIQYHEWLDGAHGRRRRIRQALGRTHRLAWDFPWVWEQWVRKD